MYKSDFNFELPENLIAQTPLESREQSRLLCMDRRSGELMHRRFYELPGLLGKGDCLVLNDSRVLPARLLGTRESGGAVEVLLLKQSPICQSFEPTLNPGASDPSHYPNPTQPPQRPEMTTWECLVNPGRKIKTGTKLIFGENELTGTVKDVLSDGNRLIEFNYDGIFLEELEKLGKMPLPPYIHEELKDAERYQTVYSREAGSAAAPTAGLHMTKRLLDELAAGGVEICYITLHVGLGTFRPVKTEKIDDHKMHSEYFTIPEETVETVNRIKADKGRVIAVGTTSCRALETRADGNGRISAFTGDTDIFIYPGYKFKCIDGLITNFHLPESTLIMLVSAFAGREKTLRAYKEAILRKYRFFSFGDAMFIS